MGKKDMGKRVPLSMSSLLMMTALMVASAAPLDGNQGGKKKVDVVWFGAGW